MKALLAATLVLVISATPAPGLAGGNCPSTTASDPLFGAASEGWYGTDSLAASLPPSGVWPTTGPRARIAVKLFWRSVGFSPLYYPQPELKVSIENLSGGPVTAIAYGPTSAYPMGDTRNLSDSELDAITREAELSDEKWLMLTGMHFPDPGCWEITGEYLGQKLTFIVETVSARTE